jgi:hypothetical protein
MKHFQIFRANVPVTSMEGTTVSFSEADLKGIAERYDPALHEAPLIVGHPQHDAPAYGWVAGLSFADGALAVQEKQVDPEFDALRTRGSFKKVSARFYTPTSKNSPTPGQYYLRDVGFLGAMAPAVKGLRSASFADDGADLATAEISFADLPAYSGTYISRLFRGLRDWLIEKEGKDTADRVLPDWEVQSLSEISTRAEAQDSHNASFGDTHSNPASKEKPTMKTAEQLQADLDAANRERDTAQARATTLEQADRQRQVDARHAEHVSFADGLISEARWPAGSKEPLVATLDHLATPAESGVVSFGDGDAAKPLHQVLREQLQALPSQVSFKQIATKPKDGDQELVSFSDQPGYESVQVDADRLALDKRIKQYMGEHKVDYATAAAHVSK